MAAPAAGRPTGAGRAAAQAVTPARPRARRAAHRRVPVHPARARRLPGVHVLPGACRRCTCRSTTGMASPRSAGSALDNYRTMWHDAEIHAAFVHSVKLILFYAVFSIMLGLFLTALMTHIRVRGFNFFRTILFLPQTIATVVVAQAFVWVYDPSGPLDEFLRDGRPRLVRQGVARRLHLGAAGRRHDRHVDHLRAVPGAVPRRGAEDPAGAVRGGARRRSGLRSRVRCGHAPGTAQRNSSWRRR